MSVCRYCYATIKWIQLEANPREQIPVEPIPLVPGEPVPRSAIAAHRVPSANGRGPGRLAGRPALEGLKPGERVYVAHRALCEQIVPDHPQRPTASQETLL